MIYLAIGLLLALFTGSYAPVYADSSAIVCTNTLISEPITAGWVVPNGVHVEADGQMVYLTSRQEADSATLYYISSDDAVTEVGQIDEVLGVYSFPRWDVDIAAGNVLFSSYVDGDYGVPSTLMLMHLDSGEVTTLMRGVNEYDFGRIDGLIWWGSNAEALDNPDIDYGFYLYDVAAETLTGMYVPTVPDTFALTAELVALLPDGDVVFTVGRLPDENDDFLTAYYRGDPKTGTSQLLHSHTSEDSPFRYSDSITVLEDRIAYINPMGEYTEIGFDGNVLRTVSLVGPGFYRDLRPTPSGVLFSYFHPDNRDVQGLYHISRSGALSALMPEGYNFRRLAPDITFTTTPDDTTIVWFSAERFNQDDRYNLYAYALPADDTVAVNEPTFVVEKGGEFYSSPEGDYLVADVDGSAVIIDTTTFEQTATDAEYHNRIVFFDEGQPRVFDEGHLEFVDTDQDIVYYSLTRLPPEDGYDDFPLYATTYEGSEGVQVNLPEVAVPFSLHWASFTLAPDNSVFYVGNTDEGQVLYRARCQRS